MRGAQKAIKYVALALAALLIVTISSGIVGGLSLVGMMVWGDDVKWGGSSEWVDTEFAGKSVTELDVNVKATTVKVRQTTEGEPVRVETNNEYITTWVDGQKLNVVEKSHGVFGWGGTGELVIYVREGVKFDNVEIVIGAGTLNIEAIETRTLKLDLGAGKTDIQSLKVSERAEIESGAGSVDIASGELRDFDLDFGAGKAALKARVTGNGKVHSGVGKTELTLVGVEDDYKFAIDKGLGSVTLNGMGLSDGQVVGTGRSLIDIDSGVGAVEIKIVEK